jgi:hypothetical protein
MKNNFTICLNMIVKNESHIIVDTLNKLISKIHIDYWVICDTGSTDNTKELILDFFDKNKIQGELYVDEWVNFGHNRTLALENAYDKTDFLFIMDADDEIVGDLIFPENIFEYDSYLLKFRGGYTRTLVINNKKKWKYNGVLHEYIECLEKNKSSTLTGDYYIISGKCGDRSKDSNKYMNDALLLEKEYKIALNNKDNIYKRYSFYCANSYKDANDQDNAIKWYKNTLSFDGNWLQEKYISCLRLYELYDKQENIENGIFYLIESYKYDSNRVECIYNLIKYYCIKKQNNIAYSFYTLIQNYYENQYINDKFINKLFVTENIYSFYLPYYMIIVCERLKKYEIGIKMYDIIFTKGNLHIGEWWIKNLVYNLQFFIEKNKDINFVTKWRNYLTLINKTGYDIDRKLVNKYEIYNISNFIELHPPNDNINIIENDTSDTDKFIVIAILAKDKESVLSVYLNCIYNQTYPKKYIHLYIRTNDNNDDTTTILTEFIEKYGNEYASVYFDYSSISDDLKKYSNHEWNSFRFNILGKIRQDSVDYAYNLHANYFVADCDNFIIPTTIENLFKNKELGIISPMLRTLQNKSITGNKYNKINYSNYHYDVQENGFYKTNNKYFSILNNEITGLIRVCCVHCSYLIPYKYLSSIKYNDNSDRYEYIIFSDILRKQNIPQYIDNTQKYGYLTFSETKEEFEVDLSENKLVELINN